MKFFPIISDIDDGFSLEDLKSEYESAIKFGAVSLSDNAIFYKKAFKCYYLPVSKIYRAFRRVKLVPTRFKSAANGEIHLEYLVLSSNKAEITEFPLPDSESANKLLEELQAKSPKIKIGKKEK